MIDLDQMPPKFYGIKLAGSIFTGRITSNYFYLSVFSPLAYLLGKASYIPECRRLILQRLPNSNLAHSLESKRYDLISDMYFHIFCFPSMRSLCLGHNRLKLFLKQQPRIYSVPVMKRKNNQSIPCRQVELKTLSTDFDGIGKCLDTMEKNAARKYVTYDELRQRNRTDYASKFPAAKARNG